MSAVTAALVAAVRRTAGYCAPGAREAATGSARPLTGRRPDSMRDPLPYASRRVYSLRPTLLRVKICLIKPEFASSPGTKCPKNL